MWDRAAAHDVRHALFGGEHAVRVWVVPTRSAPPFTIVLACELEPAGRVGVHVQERDAEMVVGVDGEGVVVVDDEPHLLIAGAVAALPLGARLAIDNASPTEPFRYLILKASAA